MDKDALAQIDEIRRELRDERERHDTAIHDLMVRLVTLEKRLLPMRTPAEEASILEDQINQMM